jgi:AcrR family transcriptional regulator
MKRSAGKLAMQERILETADRLFYGQGIRAVGVDTIAAAVGISKRTLYNYFPSKDDLIVAYLSRRLRPAKASDLPPAEQILGDFDRLERSFADGGFRGCPFVNAVAELKEPGHAANAIARSFKEQRRYWFRDLLRRLPVGDPDSLSMQLMLLVDGAIAAAVVRGDPKVARAAREAARVLLAAAVTPPAAADRSSSASRSRDGGRGAPARSRHRGRSASRAD